jgi:2-haloalkanoic acid dehalogenase type II
MIRTEMAVSSSKSLTDFKLLSFDIYGTLIDWETGIYSALTPLLKRAASSHPLNDGTAIIKHFGKVERKFQSEQPGLEYDQLLALVYTELAKALQVTDVSVEEAAAFGASVGQWPAFPDTVAAMQKLGQYYQLVVLSNVDRNSLSRTLAGPLNGVKFDAIYTAQDIGSYKPDLGNFEYLLQHVDKELAVTKAQILHTAQSLMHDHEPAKVMGITSAWIARKEGEAGMGGLASDMDGKVAYSWRFGSLGEMAAEVEKQFTFKK